jgi:hypothetical protein
VSWNHLIPVIGGVREMFGELHEYGALGLPVTKTEAVKAI